MAGLQRCTRFLADDHNAALFAGARPVASRNGRVVLELRREGGLMLSVWNPMTRDVSTLPPLSGMDDFTGDYACAILTGDDGNSPGIFRVILVYNRRTFTALRSYSSATGAWGREGRNQGTKIRDRMLRKLGPAVAVRGVAYWPLHQAALVVDPHSLSVRLLLYRLTHPEADHRVLGVSPDGEALRYLGVGFIGRTRLCISFVTSQLLGPGYRSTTGGFWDAAIDRHVEVLGIEVTRRTGVKLRWFGERSGALLFTVGEEAAGTGAVFALNVATGSLEKLADGVGYHACRDLFGYEMDYAELLASVARPSLTCS